MIDLIKTVLEKLLGLLPGSPFQGFFQNLEKLYFLPELNWFIPFDGMIALTAAWLGCILAYYIYQMVKQNVFDRIINKLFS